MARKSREPGRARRSEWTIDSVQDNYLKKWDLKAGESKQFTPREVKGKGEFSKEVFWEVAGNKDKDTRIDEKGKFIC